MLNSSQMQHLGGGQHWSGQGILEGLPDDRSNFGGSHACKPADDAFTNLLPNFGEEELPSSLQQSSTLIPFRRQRKSCRPLRIPPTLETALPVQDNSNAGLGEWAVLVEQDPLKTENNGSFFESGVRKNLGCLSPTLEESASQLRIRNDCPLPTKLDFETRITRQESGLPPSTTRNTLTNCEPSNGAMARGAAGLHSLPNFQRNNASIDSLYTTECRNGACKAKISSEASFCRRCSCCICKLFDNKKDPSLWILCDPHRGGGCGLSCHLECALKQQVAGVVDTDGSIPSLDGSYYCHSCNAIMPLLCCWKEQLLAAKEASTMDDLHHRLFLSYRLLKGTKLFKDVHSPIEEAMQIVDAEASQMALGTVMQPQCSAHILYWKMDVQRLINLALERVHSQSPASIEATKQAGRSMITFMVCFEDVSSSSIVVAVNVRGAFVQHKPLGYKLWHRKASDLAYGCTPTGFLPNMGDKFVVSNLHPLTDYTFKVVPFSVEGDIAVCEAGCSTKAAEYVEPPVDVYTSLDVLLIDTERVGGGISRCMDQSFNLEYHGDDGKNALKIQDLEEVLIDQNGQGHHLSSKSPITGKERKDNQEGSVSVYSKRGASLQDERRGLHLAQRNMKVVQEEKKVCSFNASSGPPKGKQEQTGTGNLSKRKSSYLSFDCWDDKLSRKCLRTTTTEHDVPSNGKQCYHTVSSKHLCSSNGNLPFQNWLREGDGSADAAILTSSQANMELDHKADNHTRGIFTCHSEADFYNYEFSVKVVRWLECKGHLEEEFRMKFLTWFTLKASEQEKRVISVFIDTLQDDPASLAGQLVDAFEEMIGVDRSPSALDGFCRRLW